MPNFPEDPVICTTTTANAIEGHSVSGRGLVGKSDAHYGVRGHSNKIAGVRGSSDAASGVEGFSKNGPGVVGEAEGKGAGVVGVSKNGVGVVGGLAGGRGRGVEGWSDAQYGVYGESKKSAGVRGTSADGRGVEGWSTKSEGVVGISASGNAVWGQTEGAGVGVLGMSKSGVGVWGKGGRLAGFFEGDVEVTGDIRLVQADCAEDFDIEGAVAPGTVMVLGEEGILRESDHAYDKRVAGVISGAGAYKPGIVLDKRESQMKRLPIGLLGKVYCKVDARSSPIEIGDLLTTSNTPGHAMKANDPLKAFGAVIGKALQPLKEGQGLIPILIALQ